MKHTYDKYDIKRLQEHNLLLSVLLRKHCRYLMVEVWPPICTFFDDGPRYRQSCTLAACPVMEKEKE